MSESDPIGVGATRLKLNRGDYWFPGKKNPLRDEDAESLGLGNGSEETPFLMDTTDREMKNGKTKANDVLSLSGFGIDKDLKAAKLLEVRGEAEFKKLFELAAEGDIDGLDLADFGKDDDGNEFVTLKFTSTKDGDDEYVKFFGDAAEDFVGGQLEFLSSASETTFEHIDTFTPDGGPLANNIAIGVRGDSSADPDTGAEAGFGNDALKTIASINNDNVQLEQSELDDLIETFYGVGDNANLQEDLQNALDITVLSVDAEESEALLRLDFGANEGVTNDGVRGDNVDTTVLKLTDDAYNDFTDIFTGGPTPSVRDGSTDTLEFVDGIGNTTSNLERITQGIRPVVDGELSDVASNQGGNPQLNHSEIDDLFLAFDDLGGGTFGIEDEVTVTDVAGNFVELTFENNNGAPADTVGLIFTDEAFAELPDDLAFI